MAQNADTVANQHGEQGERQQWTRQLQVPTHASASAQAIRHARVQQNQERQHSRQHQMPGVGTHELRSMDAVPSLRSSPSGVSSRSENEADFDSKVPLRAFCHGARSNARQICLCTSSQGGRFVVAHTRGPGARATLNMVHINARSWVVVAVRLSEPSMLLSFSFTGKGSVVERRDPRFHTRTSLPAMSIPGIVTVMSCALK